MSIALALDIGGTKLAAAIVDDSGRVLHRHEAPTVGETAEALFAQLGSVANAALADAPGIPDVCGVGTVGPMTTGGELVSPLNVPQWRRFPLRQSLASILPMPVIIDNDAKATALGEGWTGAARNVRNYVGMVVSTGVGGGIVLEGRLLHGRLGNAGHIGHIVVDPESSRQCSCGGYGCLEGEASGSAIRSRTGRPASEATPDVVEHTGRLVGRAVASTAMLLDLDLAVVGGSVALGFGEPFFVAAREELARRAGLDYSRGTRIVPAALVPMPGSWERPQSGSAASQPTNKPDVEGRRALRSPSPGHSGRANR